MNAKIYRLAIPLTLLALGVTGCNLGASARPTMTPFVFPTQAPTATLSVPPTATATNPALPTAAPSATTAAPTATSAPAATQPPASGATRITMATGATSAVVQGTVAAGGSVAYLAGAQAGQYMLVRIDSSNPALYLAVKSPDGTTLQAASAGNNGWQGTLPKNGDYTLSVVSSSGSGNYHLSVIIPVRVNFAKGAVSAKLDGIVQARQTNTYLLRAMKDQDMTVTITSAGKDILLTIYGLTDGTPYIRSASGQTSATIDLPSTQDYVIEAVSATDAAEKYTIEFVVK